MAEKCPKCSGSLFVTPAGNAVCESCSYRRVTKEKLQKVEEEQQSLKAAEQKRKQERQRLKAAEQKRKQERQKVEEEKAIRESYKNLTIQLSVHSENGGDYIGLESSLRTQSEDIFSRTAKKPIDEWQQEEAELIRLLLDYPKRKECLSLTMDSKEETKLILAELHKLNGHIESLLNGQRKQIGMSKDNQNAAKIGIAAHLLTGGTAGAVARGIEDAFDSDDE